MERRKQKTTTEAILPAPPSQKATSQILYLTDTSNKLEPKAYCLIFIHKHVAEERKLEMKIIIDMYIPHIP